MFRTLQDALDRGRGNERSFLCPVHDDHNASASVNVDKGVWYCYACGARGTLDNVLKYVDTDHVLEDVLDILNDREPEYPEAWLAMFDAGPVHPYWLSRFDEATCRHFRFGYDPAREQPCYPMRNAQGDVVGIVRRRMEPDVKDRYRYPRGVKRSEYLFNYRPEQVDVVTLAEGATTVAAIWEAEHEAFGIYGSELSPQQVTLINRVAPKRIVLAFDNDKAGREKTQKAVELLSDYDVYAIDWTGYESNDLGDLDVETRKKILSQPLAIYSTSD